MTANTVMQIFVITRNHSVHVTTFENHRGRYYLGGFLARVQQSDREFRVVVSKEDKILGGLRLSN